jgi:death on curing protein
VSAIIFLSRGLILELHRRSLREHGGSEGIRDEGGLESAIAQAQHDHYYGGVDLFGVAAAYAFHIAEAQAFIDGNKRTGIGAALLCLELGGVDTTVTTSDILYDAMIAIARRELDKAGLAALLRQMFGPAAHR